MWKPEDEHQFCFGDGMMELSYKTWEKLFGVYNLGVGLGAVPH